MPPRDFGKTWAWTEEPGTAKEEHAVSHAHYIFQPRPFVQPALRPGGPIDQSPFHYAFMLVALTF
jgi:hypothetical protein